MTRPPLAALACAAFLAAPARAAAPSRAADAAPAAPRPKVVALRFAWPRELAADVTYARARTQEGKPAGALELRGKLAVAPRGEDLVVRYQGWAGGDGDAAAVLRASEKVALVVGEDGRVRSVDGVADAVDAMRRLPGFSGDAPATRKALDLAPQLVEKEARETWALLVGFWSENDLELSEAYETESEVPVAAVPGATVRIRVEVRATRWVDCPGPKGGRCVELKMRSQADREDAAKVVSALVERLGAPRDAVKGALGDLAVVTDATVITEPSTLVPHRLEIRKTGEATGPGGATISRVDAQTWTYAYPTARR
jgi:hypothetical protein